MAAEPAAGAKICKHCRKPVDSSTGRRYLTFDRLCLHELPLHPDLVGGQDGNGPTLVGFLQQVLAEAYAVDFDDGTWSSQGKYPSSENTRVSIPGVGSAEEKSVRVEVEKRVKDKDGDAFLARRSVHDEGEVEYGELDAALSRDHCAKEAIYDPSIFDGNRVLEWSAEDLKIAVQELKPEWRVQSVQIAMYEMFHTMPKVSGLSLLDDRGFFVLCISAHSANPKSPATEGQSKLHAQSHTLQLPVNIESLHDVKAIASRSHFQQKSKTYSTEHITTPTERQKKHNGKKITEGIYCSLERLLQVSDSPAKFQWDMMTRSDAKGSTKLAPKSITRKETLEAIAKDVQYVLEYIRKQRLAAKGAEQSTS